MINFVDYTDVWTKVKRAARTTIHKDGEGMYPSKDWKKRMLLCEHSPIRKIHFSWIWDNLPSWVSVHFVRHHLGIEHFVSTQRTDRTGVNRNELPQNAPVCHECDADAQALIYISRRRLCKQASPETREAWLEVKGKIQEIDPELASAMVPECIYRGFCPEFKSKCCGYVYTDAYKKALEEYRNCSI